MDDSYNLQRFVDAQQAVFADVTAELRRGSKRGHWMWFVFPQLKGLGRTEQSNFFGISSLQEAVAYLQHPILGPRLIECAHLVNDLKGRSAEEIFGQIDAMKFRSSMTLFGNATLENEVFMLALEKFFEGKFDPLTVDYLRKEAST